MVVRLGVATVMVTWCQMTAGRAEELDVDTTRLAYRGRDFRNPFRALLPAKVDKTQSMAVVDPPPLVITGMVWNARKPSAIVDGQLVGVGDVVNEAEIVAIERQSIRVRYHQQEFVIEVP